MRRLVAILVFIAVSMLMVACGGSSNSTAQAPSAAGSGNAGSPPPSSGSSGGSSSSGSSGASGGSSAGGASSGANPGSGSGSGTGSSGGSGSGSGGTPQSGFTETKLSLPHAGGVITADFNRDGRPDLLIYSSSLLLLVNNGSGNFGGITSIALPAAYTEARQVALADFNGDGYIDVVACVNNATSLAGAAVVYLNDHSGNLTAGQVVAAPSMCQGVAAGDANHDGKPDIALTYFTGTNASPSNSIATWFNDGSGRFAGPVTQNVALTATQDSTRNPCSMAGAAGADFDGDGTLDLMLFGACQSSVVTPGDVYLARGTGLGQYVLTKIDEGNSSLSGTPMIKDINGDGKPDVVYVQELEGPHGSSTSDLKFAVNNGSGAFALTTAASENAYAGNGAWLHSGNSFKGANTAIEGYSASPCCTDPATYGLKVFTQIGSAPFQNWTYGQAPEGSYPGAVTGVVTADFDGNGTQDIAAVEQNANGNATLHAHLNFNK